MATNMVVKSCMDYMLEYQKTSATKIITWKITAKSLIFYANGKKHVIKLADVETRL